MSLAPLPSAAVDPPAPVVRAVADRVRERLRAEQADPQRHPGRAEQVAVAEVRAHNDFALARGFDLIDDEAACVRAVLAMVTGFGPLQSLLDDPTVEEIWINSPDRVYFARAGRSHRAPLVLTDEAVRGLVERMLHATGRRVDLSQPFVDASLPDGSRLHCVIPDITRSHWAVNIRKFLASHRTLSDLVAARSLTPQIADILTDAMASGRSVLVSGATHAG
ncbi:ATPase, T2SS/T4P/T4SS family, partial [Microbacterium sp.]|uniref:ATPase, T2SS/T4P/T4SS family n=1 Tax=Microbacterium sp. TaxID=51671 RepID=UPI0025D3AEA7